MYQKPTTSPSPSLFLPRFPLYYCSQFLLATLRQGFVGDGLLPSLSLSHTHTHPSSLPFSLFNRVFLSLKMSLSLSLSPCACMASASIVDDTTSNSNTCQLFHLRGCQSPQAELGGRQNAAVMACVRGLRQRIIVLRSILMATLSSNKFFLTSQS